MAVKLRLARKGTTKKPFYWIVAQDVQMPRNGRFLEKLGTYNPRTDPASLELKTDRINLWLDKGATPTSPVRSLLREYGILKARAQETTQETEGPEPAETSSPG